MLMSVTISLSALFYLDVVAILAGQHTCDSQVAGSSPGRAPLHSGIRQATYTLMCLYHCYLLTSTSLLHTVLHSKLCSL